MAFTYTPNGTITPTVWDTENKNKKVHIDSLRAALSNLDVKKSNICNCGNCAATNCCQACQGCQTCQATACQTCQGCQTLTALCQSQCKAPVVVNCNCDYGQSH